MPESLFDVIDAGNGKLIKAWKRGVPFEDAAIEQLKNCARMPFVQPYVAAMPDTHAGWGSTVGSVIPMQGAICPSAVGVDIGCGMMACKVTLDDLDIVHPMRLPLLRQELESAIPSGRTNNGGAGDRGAWHDIPEENQQMWDAKFQARYEAMCVKNPGMRSKNTVNQLGTLGTGNHFLELSRDLDTNELWVVLHSGSRGLGNKIGSYFTNVAKALCEKWFIALPDPDLAYLPENTQQFQDYIDAVSLAQEFAWVNRQLMMRAALRVLGAVVVEYVHCHHNYLELEHHHGKKVFIVRKGAVRARAGEMGIIPGSMGARTYIVRGLGSLDSFCSCSHGAGRAMSRTQAEKVFTVSDHVTATAGVECDKSTGVLDETPGAYKSIENVMAAQADLCEPVHILKQFLCVKGVSDKQRRQKL